MQKTPPYNGGFQEEYTVTPVARIRSDFKEKFGVPRQSGRAQTEADVLLLPPYNVRDAVRKIEEFSHLWLIFGFSKNGSNESLTGENFTPLVRPPRLGGNEKTGVFACRSPFRPNALGLSCVKLLKVLFPESGGVILRVSGADLVDGTPVYDIKPYLPSSDKIETATGGFADEHASDFLHVDFPKHLLNRIPQKKRAGLTQALQDDPRPAYHSDPARVYGMLFSDFNVRFTVENNVLRVIDVEDV